MNRVKEIGIRFGVLSPPIAEQLTEQGFTFDANKIATFEAHRDRLTHLRFADLLSDSVYDKVLQKLFAKIKNHVQDYSKLTTQKNPH